MHVDGAGGGIIMIGDTITLFKSGSDSDTLVNCSYYIEQQTLRGKSGENH